MTTFKGVLTGVLGLVLVLPGAGQQTRMAVSARRESIAQHSDIELWRDRGNVAKLNLLDGPAGKNRGPGNEFKFVKESKKGSSPKFVVEDEKGAKWKVKLGPEAKPETAAARLVWAAGYYVDEDYYREQIHVTGMQRLSRGNEFVSEGGLVKGVRLERNPEGKEPKGWNWHNNPVKGTRQFNGLRVMMALINNWDLKTENNAVYDLDNGRQRYVVADLGASFGRTGSGGRRSRGVMKDYVHAKFVQKVTPEHVDLVMYSRPFFLLYIFRHRHYGERTKMESITKHIPIEDARWLGNLLGRYSSAQIADCFRSAGFSPSEVDGYTKAVMQRINTLKQL